MDLGDSLLHPELGEAGADQDLLPTGTQTYVSVCRYSRIYWLIVAGMFTVFPILLLIATINSGAVWLILTILWFLGSALGSWYEVRKNKRDYKAKVASGAWHEGLFVFPSGDIVVRFNSLLKKQETHIEVSALSKAAVTKRFAMVRGGEVDFLQLHFVDNMGRPMLMEVCGEDLVEDINAIAEHINETKRKGLGGF